MSFNLTSSAAIIRKAGYNASSWAVQSYALLANYCDDAEGWIMAETRRDWVTNYSGLPQALKGALGLATSAIAAKCVINYDMSGYTNRIEAETMLDVLTDMANKIISFLKDFNSNEIKNP